MHLLMIEDDRILSEKLIRQLEAEGYAVEHSANGTEGFDFAASGSYDAILLDIMLPGMDGLSVLRALRARGNGVPILMMSARNTVADRVLGLDAGADDYLGKPFAFEELAARLRALLRRQLPGHAVIQREGTLEMDTVSHEVRRDGRIVPLSAKEYAVLELLMRNRGITLPAERIYDHVWGYRGSGDTNLVPVYIGYLRGKLDAGRENKLIHTVRGFGYVLKSTENVL